MLGLIASVGGPSYSRLISISIVGQGVGTPYAELGSGCGEWLSLSRFLVAHCSGDGRILDNGRRTCLINGE